MHELLTILSVNNELYEPSVLESIPLLTMSANALKDSFLYNLYGIINYKSLISRTDSDMIWEY